MAPLLALPLLICAFTTSAAATRSETVLASWSSNATNGLSLRPSDQPDGSALLAWWNGFNTANVTETSSGTTFTQNPHVATFPPTPSTPTVSLGTLDHVKHLAITAPVNVSATRKLVYSVRMSAQITLPTTLPYTVFNAQDDLRLATCTAVLADFATGMVADVFFTNTGIWALYERLPFSRTAEYDYAAFSSLRRIGSRTSSSQVHDLQIKYDSIKNVLEWHLDGKLKHRVARVGYRAKGMRHVLDLGGVEEEVRPTSFTMGLGCLTLLDFSDGVAPASSPLVKTGLINLNPTAPGAPRESYVMPRFWQADTRGLNGSAAAADVSLRLFGQGTSMTVSSFKVSYQ